MVEDPSTRLVRQPVVNICGLSSRAHTNHDSLGSVSCTPGDDLAFQRIGVCAGACRWADKHVERLLSAAEFGNSFRLQLLEVVRPASLLADSEFVNYENRAIHKR